MQMNNKAEFYNKFKNEFSEREFDPTETMKWLTSNKTITGSWGFQKPTNIMNKGLIFKVNGHHHKGWVLITLGWNDTYTLRFFSTQFKETKNKITDVYCDVLQVVVDNAVEKINDYSF